MSKMFFTVGIPISDTKIWIHLNLVQFLKAVSIWKPNTVVKYSKNGLNYAPLFRSWLEFWKPCLKWKWWLVEYQGHGSNSLNIDHQTGLDHLNTRLVKCSDPLGTYLFFITFWDLLLWLDSLAVDVQGWREFLFGCQLCKLGIASGHPGSLPER